MVMARASRARLLDKSVMEPSERATARRIVANRNVVRTGRFRQSPATPPVTGGDNGQFKVEVGMGAWLALGGAIWLLTGAEYTTSPFIYDAMLHSLFLGFVVSMTFGHAPIILPAVLRIGVTYRPRFYIHLVLLHLALIENDRPFLRAAVANPHGYPNDALVEAALRLEDSVAAIHDQNGLAIIPHPFMPVYFGSIQPGMLRRLLEHHRVDGIEMMFTAPIGARRRRVLDEFYSRNTDRLGAAVGGSDCHFGAQDMGRVLTVYEGDFRTAVQLRTTRPQAGPTEFHVSLGLALRQQWAALVDLPLRRRRGQL